MTREVYIGVDSSVSPDETAAIYNPEAFIQKIDGKMLYKSLSLDPNSFVQLSRVSPGKTVIKVLLTSDYQSDALGSRWKEWRFAFAMPTEPGHAYYIYETQVGGKPAVVGLDLGKLGSEFEPPLADVGTAYKLGLADTKKAEHDKEYAEFYSSLKQRGKPVKLEMVDEKPNLDTKPRKRR